MALGNSTLSITGCVMLSAVACVAEPNEPNEQSEYVDLYLDDGIDVCGGQLAAYDAFLERIFGVWAGDVPDDFRAEVHVLGDSEMGTEARTLNGVAFLGNQWSQYHELGHVMHHAADGTSTTSLMEGTADALGPLWEYVYEPDELADLEPDFLFDLSSSDYGYAAVFTRFLLDSHGNESLREFFRTMDEYESSDQAAYKDEFEIAFGEPFDSAWPTFVSERRCAYDFWYCDDGEGIELPYMLDGIDCGAPDTLGYDASSLELSAQPYGPQKILHLKNVSPRRVSIEVQGGVVYVGQCGDCGEQHWFSVGSGGSDPGVFEVDVTEGTEVFIFRANGDGPPRLAIEEVP